MERVQGTYGRTFLSVQTNILPPTGGAKIASYTNTAQKRLDNENLINVPEYSTEIANYFLDTERALYRDRSYMPQQTQVTERMRKILVDWMVDVCAEFKHHPETFFLAVDIVDRYLCCREIQRAQLQLVGVSAVLIASKHEEVWPPTVNECVAVTANTYNNRSVIDMEREIATTLRFRFTVPTLYQLGCRFLDLGHASPEVRDATLLFLESAAHCYSLLAFLPSRGAAASYLLATITVHFNVTRDLRSTAALVPQVWNDYMTRSSQNITLSEIIPAATELLGATQRLCSVASRLQAVRRKYSSSRYHNVASLEFPDVSVLSS